MGVQVVSTGKFVNNLTQRSSPQFSGVENYEVNWIVPIDV